jgi:MoxR-like ATPase
VTAAGDTMKLDRPFFVLATQNPIEQEGTYPLPEAQLDRFMLELRIDYPTRAEEEQVAQQTTGASEPEVRPVLGAEELLSCRSWCDACRRRRRWCRMPCGWHGRRGRRSRRRRS